MKAESRQNRMCRGSFQLDLKTGGLSEDQKRKFSRQLKSQPASHPKQDDFSYTSAVSSADTPGQLDKGKIIIRAMDQCSACLTTGHSYGGNTSQDGISICPLT